MEQYFATAGLFTSSVPEFLSLYSKYAGGEKQMVSYINKLLSTAKTRQKGLAILTESIPNLSADTLAEYAVTWVKGCIVQHAEDTLKEVKLGALVKLITHASLHHDFDKAFVSDHLSKVLEMCLESSSQYNIVEVALKCLSVCLSKYPNWFNPHTKKIEAFLLKFLDHSSEDVVKRAAEAFHYLQQAGGGGLNKVNYINNFTSSFHKLCGNVSVLLNELSADFTEIDDSTNMALFDLMPIQNDNDYIENYYKISQRLINCVQFLKTMLKKPFLATKIIKPKILIGVIRNGMAMHVCICQPDIKHEDWHRSEILKKIQVYLLYLLQMLLAWLKSNAFPYSHTISTMLVDCFLNCDKCKCFKVNNLYFKTLNHVFIQWIRLVKGIHPNFQMKIFSVLCNNITPVTNKVSLIIDTNATGSKSKKSKRRAIEQKVVNSGKEFVQRFSCQEQLILEHNTATSLRTLRSILELATGIKTEILQKLYKTTVGIALDVQAGRCSVPYNNIQCQVELFKLLTAFLEQDDASYLISIHPITKILSNGAKSGNKEISITCESGLKVLEKLCQPICPYITSTLHNIAPESTHENIKDADSTEPLDCVCLSEYENEDELPSINVESKPLDTAKYNYEKSIKILSVETIVPPVEPNIPDVSNFIADETPMQIDDDEKPPIVEVQMDQEDNDVEFVKEEVIISDDESNNSKDLHKMTNNVLIRSDNHDIANEIIKTVNQVVTEEVCQVIDNECEVVTEKDVHSEKTTCEEDEDMLKPFVEELVDY